MNDDTGKLHHWSSRVVSCAMYSWAICRVSYLESWVSGPRPGRTPRSRSNPWFSRSIRRRSRALAASRLFFITDSGSSSWHMALARCGFTFIPVLAELGLLFIFSLALSSTGLMCLALPGLAWPRLLRSTGLSSMSMLEAVAGAMARVASGFLTPVPVPGSSTLKALLYVLVSVGAMVLEVVCLVSLSAVFSILYTLPILTLHSLLRPRCCRADGLLATGAPLPAPDTAADTDQSEERWADTRTNGSTNTYVCVFHT